jgi:hypothetical protein
MNAPEPHPVGSIGEAVTRWLTDTYNAGHVMPTVLASNIESIHDHFQQLFMNTQLHTLMNIGNDVFDDVFTSIKSKLAENKAERLHKLVLRAIDRLRNVKLRVCLNESDKGLFLCLNQTAPFQRLFETYLRQVHQSSSIALSHSLMQCNCSCCVID